MITTIAGTNSAGFAGDGGSATSAKLQSPMGVAFDGAGDLYIADSVRRKYYAKDLRAS